MGGGRLGGAGKFGAPSPMMRPCQEVVEEMARANDDEGNIYRDRLGPYRGVQPAFYRNHPVIFDQESTSLHPRARFLGGSLTHGKGILGTIFSGSFQQGKNRLIIYGDPKTGKPSSWTLYEWLGSGKFWPETNTELYEWKRLPNAQAALTQRGFYELLTTFETGAYKKPGDERK